jgi:hypothetical protein
LLSSMIDRCWFRITATMLVAILGGMVTTWPTPIVVDRVQAATVSNSKIYVLPYQPLSNQTPPEILNQTTDLLRKKIKQSKEISLQNGPLVIPKEISKQPSVSDRDLKEANKLRQDGEAKFRNLRFDEAIASLSSAMAGYERSLVLISDFESIAQTLLMLAVCHFREEHEDQAKEYLAKRILLNPTVALDPEQYPSMFRTLVQSVRSTVTAKHRGELEIRANASGATIHLNGREVGVTPLILKNLLPGDYYLQVNKQGLQPWAGKVTVVSSRRGTARAVLGGVEREVGPLAEIAEAVRANVLTRPTLNKIQAYGKTLHATFMVVGGIYPVDNNYNVSSLLVRIADKHVCALPTIQLHSKLLSTNSDVHALTDAIESQRAKCTEPLHADKIPVVQPLKAYQPGPKAAVLIPESDASVRTQPQPTITLTNTAPLTNSTAQLAAVPIDKPAITKTTTAPTAMVPKPDSPPPILAKPMSEKPKSREAWYESWWFLSIVGTVVVAGCIGGMAAGGLFNKSSSASFKVTW